MKVFSSITFFGILLSCYLSSAFDIPQPIREAMEELHRKCLKKTGASLEHIHKCSEKEIPADPDAKCYLACLHDNANVDLEKRVAEIEKVEHDINDDIHGLVTAVRQQCDDASFDKIGGCEGAWQRTNCHLKAHHDTQHFCELLKSFN